MIRRAALTDLLELRRITAVKLTGAVLAGLELTNVSLFGVDTNLSSARLDGARFPLATYDDGTRFPPGFSAARHGTILVEQESR